MTPPGDFIVVISSTVRWNLFIVSGASVHPCTVMDDLPAWLNAIVLQYVGDAKIWAILSLTPHLLECVPTGSADIGRAPVFHPVAFRDDQPRKTKRQCRHHVSRIRFQKNKGNACLKQRIYSPATSENHQSNWAVIVSLSGYKQPYSDRPEALNVDILHAKPRSYHKF